MAKKADVQIFPLLPAPGGAPKHYSRAGRAGNIIFVAGLCSRDPKQNYKTVGTTLAEQMEVCFERIRGVLAEAGTSLENAVDLTVYLQDIRSWHELKDLLPKYFSVPPPPATIIESKLVRAEEFCEIKVTAMIPDKD
jgi:2-iminobutanoate/2-iminopropanoate deaminase